MLIPTVVALDERKSPPRWIVGAAAAGTTGGVGIQVFSDWKRSLFATEAGAIANSGLTRKSALKIAGAFLRELRGIVHKEKPELADVPVRLTVPQLDDVQPPDEWISALLDGAGWRPARNRAALTEPETNALGVFSRGLNVTWIPPQQDHRGPPSRQINMQRMLDPRLARPFRHMREGFAVLTTDVGAFTTDFGYIWFDSSFRDDRWSEPVVRQRSVRLGIHELDAAVLDLLEPAVQRHFKAGPRVEWERRKRELYAGNSQRVSVNGRVMEIGADFEAESIRDQIKQFADRIVRARDRFCSALGITAVDAEAVTGGGAAIETLRARIVGHAEAHARTVIDLRSSAEPEHATAAGAGKFTEAKRDRRLSENAELVRTASAIGGASVFFE
ncbi:MAG: hypothetical protein LCH84_08405 [Gemmatimonadetes bacterium]|nr:hypothetical protein [Gemmatimonadota bacterium]